MLYISKGIQCKAGKNKIIVAWRGKEFSLEGAEANLWQLGCFDSSLASAQALEALINLSLVETGETDDPLHLYRLLTNCVICPAPMCLLRWPLRFLEWKFWRWIRMAGLRLSLAELVFLYENGVRPQMELLGSANRQALVEIIYNTETISDGILEARMENAYSRDDVVMAMLGLLRKRRIFLI